MQRHLTAQSEKTFRTPPPSKTLERQFGAAMSKMVAAMAKQFENQTLNSLSEKTIDKFEGEQFEDSAEFTDICERHKIDFTDAPQVGNFANIFLGLSRQSRRKILRRFDNDRIDQMVKQVLDRSNKSASRALYSRVEREIGIDSNELIRTEALKPETNALILESQQWAKKLRDDVLEEFTANTLRVMSTGADFETVMNEYRGDVKKQRNHAQFIARNQIQNFNSLSAKIKAQNLGVEEAIWRTAQDERVRLCHEAREGKRFRLDKGLASSCDGKTLLPGIDFNCRCTYEMIIPEED